MVWATRMHGWMSWCLALPSIIGELAMSFPSIYMRALTFEIVILCWTMDAIRSRIWALEVHSPLET